MLDVLIDDLTSKFGIPGPHIAVCGLNPHAGDLGHLGREEIEVISPVIEDFRARGHAVSGPLPADTAFVPDRLASYDAILAMFHDQGLPVIKHSGFSEAVNVTLGIPAVRTSVDHGTALDLAGRASIDPSIDPAIDLGSSRAAPGSGRAAGTVPHSGAECPLSPCHANRWGSTFCTTGG